MTFQPLPGTVCTQLYSWPTVWASLARKMGPQALRMKLNTLLRHDVFSVEQLSSTVSEASTNVTSDKRLGQSFYNRADYVADCDDYISRRALAPGWKPPRS
jgi:60 kDa SS-A/Ro ribonucleoprotein